MQKDYSVKYIDSLLTNSKNHKTNEDLHNAIAKVKFKNIGQAIFILKALSNENYGLELEELLEHTKMRTAILSLMPKNDIDKENMIKKMNDPKDKEVINKMLETI
jgi:hypothetical protein